MTDKKRKICEDLVWEVDESEGFIELSRYTPLGEDFTFSVEPDNMIADFRSFWSNFDPDEHAVMWFNDRYNIFVTPHRLQDFLDDAEVIDRMLNELATTLEYAEED